MMEEVIVSQELASTCWELRMPGLITFSMAAPTILIGGTEKQKKDFLPKIQDGTHIWCQCFSEPDAGSDLANLSTRAQKKDGHYVVSGQKVWTTYAHFADYCLLLARTDPDSVRHKGLSYFLVDMKLPGVEVRNLDQITGDAMFNEVFFDEVRVPEEMLVGKEGEGWHVAITTLMFERTLGDAAKAAEYKPNLQKMIELAGRTKRAGKPVLSDPVFRQQLAQAYIEITVLKYHGLRSLSNQLSGGVPGPEGSIGKLLWSEPHVRLCEAALGMQGPNGQILKGSSHAIQDGYWQYHFLESKSDTIAAGTSEVLRNIIGERILGLPKDASRSRSS
jgi:alkylation response protein AidB-like acyl-CoA dehydrogenase